MKQRVMGRVAYHEPVPREEVTVIPMPQLLRVITVFSTQRGCWVTKVHAVAKDASSPRGELGFFGSEWTSPARPTKDEMHRQLSAWLAHEVAEHLGLHPHEVKP